MVIVQHPIQTISFWGTGRDHYRATPDMTNKCDHHVEVNGYQGFKAHPPPPIASGIISLILSTSINYVSYYTFL